MGEGIVDLRSDTVTRPTEGMRQAILAAPLGDDVMNDDPTVLALQKLAAEMLGKEAALYMPSGTMTNQIGVRIHCKPGDEFLCEVNCHILNYEQGAFAQLSGVVGRPIVGDRGILQPEQFVGLIRPENEHLVRTRLVCLENTHNRGVGRVQPYDAVEAICAWAHENGLRTHLDGARLFNAAVASGIDAAKWASHFDTVSICFSKGLGAPVGSALVGSQEFIQEARRHRKAFGGAMRQAGVIAAGALYALEHHVDRLAEDHAHAGILADAVEAAEGLELHSRPDTNIVFFDVDAALGEAAEFVAALQGEGVYMLALGPEMVRAVTHLDVSEDQVRRAAEVIPRVAHECASGLRSEALKTSTY